MKLSELIRNAQATIAAQGDMEVWIEDTPEEMIDANEVVIETYLNDVKNADSGFLKAFVILSKAASEARDAKV